MRLGRDISAQELNRVDFNARADALINQYPEVVSVGWIDERQRVRGTRSTATGNALPYGEHLPAGDTESTFSLTRDLQQPVYSRPSFGPSHTALLQLHVPINAQGQHKRVGRVGGDAGACCLDRGKKPVIARMLG